MNTKQFATEMRTAIADIQSKGINSIPCNNLIAYLDNVISSPGVEPSQVEVANYKARLQNLNESRLEMFRSVITAGQGAIRSSLLLNGGAAVALLAFMGHLAQHDSEKVTSFAICLVAFAFGSLAIVMTSGLTYLSQWFYASDSSSAQKCGRCLNVSSIILGVISYGLFAWGIFEVYCEFQHYAGG